jgi:hypothetical protein
VSGERNRRQGVQSAHLSAVVGPAGQNGGVPLYRDEAVVLRTHKLGEADRIITALTRTRGKIRTVAKGRAADLVALRRPA